MLMRPPPSVRWRRNVNDRMNVASASATENTAASDTFGTALVA